MFKKIRPLVFKFDPETAHNLAVKALKFNIIPIRLKSKFRILETEIFNKNIPNPIGLAAGFDKDAEVYNSIFKLGFGFVEVGTITPLKQYGNPKPRVFRLEEDEALINRLGFNNSGADNIKSRIQANKPIGLLGINIGPNKDTLNRIQDFIIGFKKFYDLADYITINISSPNTERLRNFHSKNELNELLDTIINEKEKLKTSVPIVVKISPDINDKEIDEITQIILKFNIPAVIISNTSDRSRDSLKNINKLEKGGLSGKPIEKQSNMIINKFFKNFEKKVKIIGVGGVDSGESAYEKILNGASLVQLYTGMVYNGPRIANKICNDLNNLLKKQGVTNISEIVGTKK